MALSLGVAAGADTRLYHHFGHPASAVELLLSVLIYIHPGALPTIAAANRHLRRTLPAVINYNFALRHLADDALLTLAGALRSVPRTTSFTARHQHRLFSSASLIRQLQQTPPQQPKPQTNPDALSATLGATAPTSHGQSTDGPIDTKTSTEARDRSSKKPAKRRQPKSTENIQELAAKPGRPQKATQNASDRITPSAASYDKLMNMPLADLVKVPMQDFMAMIRFLRTHPSSSQRRAATFIDRLEKAGVRLTEGLLAFLAAVHADHGDVASTEKVFERAASLGMKPLTNEELQRGRALAHAGDLEGARHSADKIVLAGVNVEASLNSVFQAVARYGNRSKSEEAVKWVAEMSARYGVKLDWRAYNQVLLWHVQRKDLRMALDTMEKKHAHGYSTSPHLYASVMRLAMKGVPLTAEDGAVVTPVPPALADGVVEGSVVKYPKVVTELLAEMRRNNLELVGDTVTVCLESCVMLKDPEGAWKLVHEHRANKTSVLDNYEKLFAAAMMSSPDAFNLFNDLIAFYGEVVPGKPKMHSVFEDLIQGLSILGDYSETLDHALKKTFDAYIKLAPETDRSFKVYVAVIRYHLNKGDEAEALKFLRELEQEQASRSHYGYNAVIAKKAAKGDKDGVYALFDEMKSKGHRVDAHTFGLMLPAVWQSGPLNEDAIKILEQFREMFMDTSLNQAKGRANVVVHKMRTLVSAFKEMGGGSVKQGLYTFFDAAKDRFRKGTKADEVAKS
ncbi:hypothetical protein HDU96_001700 [Phlyctochytrium bullatum]|nr:hypothetical protein HDU96_001700 [Phlyctochytrium bullatum]